MDTIAPPPSSGLYFLFHQIGASSILAISGFLFGVLIAWLFWGRKCRQLDILTSEKDRTIKVRKEVARDTPETEPTE